MARIFPHLVPNDIHQIPLDPEHDFPHAAFQTKHCYVYYGGCGYRMFRERPPMLRKVHGHCTGHKAAPIHTVSILMEHELYNLRFLEPRRCFPAW